MNEGRTMYKVSTGAKASIVYTLSSLLTKGLMIFTMPIFTRIMSTKEIGIVNLYTTWYSMISIISTLSLTSGGLQLALKEFKDQRDKYLSAVLTLTSGMALLIFIILVSNIDFWVEITGLSAGLLILMVLQLFLSPAQEFWMTRQRFEYKYKTVAAVTFLTTFAASFVSVISIIIASKHDIEELANVRLISNYTILLSVSLIIWIYIYWKGKTIYNKKYWEFSLRLSIPLIGNSIAVQILGVSDRIMISKMLGESCVGVYSTLYSVGSISLVIWQAINASFIPYLYMSMDNAEKRRQAKMLASKILLFFAIITIIFTLIAPEIVQILATSEYYEAVYIIPPITSGIYFTSVSNMYSNILIYYKKTKYIMISSSLAAFVNITLNFWGIKKYGYIAAAYTTLLAYIILAIIQCLISNKVHRATALDDSDSVYHIGQIIWISISTVILCLSALFLYNFIILRYVILMGAILFVLWKRDLFFSIIYRK